MQDLSTIIANNKRAAKLGLKCGVTSHAEPLPSRTDGLQDWSVGEHYPWSVQPRTSDLGTTCYVVVNYASGYESARFRTYAAAERLMLRLKGG